ncbi:MAG TPA: T9SS type A sorting domain-containing protein [Bacteroidia bacterium]|jgi:sugar lactone lactonase YvrE|nr:T9SS type A sorting domain-containing protein [Bacteroidia bacterium]
MKNLFSLLVLVFCLKVNAQIITDFAGTGSQGFSGNGGQATNAKLSNPIAVCFDQTGNLYIADILNNCIRKVNTLGIITTFAGNGTWGYTGDGGQAVNAETEDPISIAADNIGNIYFSDEYNNRVRKVNTLGVISTVAGNGTQGFSGDGGQATNAELFEPSGVALDYLGNLYISDRFNGRIRKVNTSGIINTIAGTGIQGYSGDGGQATIAELNNPTGIAVDTIGNLYIADFFNNCIRKVNTSGIITTIAGTGTNGYSGDGGYATAAEFNNPFGVTINKAGDLYIADTENNCVRGVNQMGIITTVAGNTIYGSYGDGGQATSASLEEPDGVTCDAMGNLYITDSGGNEIRKVTFGRHITGILEVTNNNNLNIYPNPTNGSFIIESNSSEKQTLQVFDINGKLVLSQTINGKTIIDASILSEGVYNISLISNEGVVNKRLVIVR